MKTSRTQEQRFLPWAYEDHALTLALIDAELDGHSLVVDPRSQTIDLASEWSCARLELELAVPNRVLARVLAKPERASPPVAGLITLRCDKTHLRERVCLRPWAQADAGRFRATLTLARDDLAGPVSLDAFLVRSAAAIERQDPILYLNSDHERVRAALDSKGTTGRRARMRDLVFERIAVGVWSQLIVRAAARLVEDGDCRSCSTSSI